MSGLIGWASPVNSFAGTLCLVLSALFPPMHSSVQSYRTIVDLSRTHGCRVELAYVDSWHGCVGVYGNAQGTGLYRIN
ncbi:hypothetical protein J3F84DRAFT_358873, partial [Trichoderma pleuroticola]